MKNRRMAWKKISICLLILAVGFSAATGGRTGAWFVDAGTWVESSYGIGVIDYTVYLNGENVEKLKGGQGVALALPLVGGAKLCDPDKGAAAGAVSSGGRDEFDEAVTLVRARIVNTGGLPIGIRAAVTGAPPAAAGAGGGAGSEAAAGTGAGGGTETGTGAGTGAGVTEAAAGSLTDNGILYLVLPYGAEVDQARMGLTLSGGSFQSYRSYIRGCLGLGPGSPGVQPDGSIAGKVYGDLVSALSNYYNTPQTPGSAVLNNTVVYPGKLLSSPNLEAPVAEFQVNVLCWAEYDAMPWSAGTGDAARDNTKAVEQRDGVLTLTIECVL